MTAVSPALIVEGTEHEEIDGGLLGAVITLIVPQNFDNAAPLASVAVIVIEYVPDTE